MSFQMSTESVGLVIFIIAVITLLTRWGGVVIMSLIPINQRTQRFISAMSASVLVAILAPIALQGDLAARLALLVTALVAIVSKKPLLAIAFGIITAAFSRQLYI